jgi:hypothetical protein
VRAADRDAIASDKLIQSFPSLAILEQDAVIVRAGELETATGAQRDRRVIPMMLRS